MKRRVLTALSLTMLAILAMVGMAQATSVGTSGSDMQGPGLSLAVGGVGLKDLASVGTKTISLNIGGPVQHASLYWTGRDFPCAQDAGGNCILTDKDQDLIFDGTPITGAVTGTEVNFATADGQQKTNNIGFKADVTAIVQAKGTGVQSFTIQDGDTASNLWRLNGAGLLVVYSDSSDPTHYRIIVSEGLDFAFIDAIPDNAKVTDPVTYAYAASTDPRMAELIIFAGDGEADRQDTITITDNPDLLNKLDGSSGPEFDADVFPISIPAGASSTTVQLHSQSNAEPTANPQPDSLLWVLSALRIPVFTPAPSIDIEKATNGHDADTPTGPILQVGSTVEWTYVVTNTGNVTLTNVEVTDDKIGAISCPNSTLTPGESMQCAAFGTATEGQYANLGTVTGDYAGITVTDEDPSHYFGDIVIVGGRGCTPGYWKQPHHFDSWVGYSPSNKYDAVFGVTSSFGSSFTLLNALKQGGGGEKALGRHAVAALLNASNPDVPYLYSVPQVIALVQQAYATGDFEGIKDILEEQNEMGCPLN